MVVVPAGVSTPLEGSAEKVLMVPVYMSWEPPCTVWVVIVPAKTNDPEAVIPGSPYEGARGCEPTEEICPLEFTARVSSAPSQKKPTSAGGMHSAAYKYRPSGLIAKELKYETTANGEPETPNQSIERL